jgi:YesN/AraC family two-component response regulator
MATILIVDDEPGIVEIIKDFFEEEGYRIYTADTAEDGVRLVQQIKPDLLMVDMKLPDGSGLKVLISAKQSSPRTKTIVITGYVDQSVIDEAEKVGRDVFLQKPFDLQILKKEVDGLLGVK